MTTPGIKRVYEPAADGDGTRILIDRLWPRGLTKNKARVDVWLKDIAPSPALRKRFHSGKVDWDRFCAAYFVEMEGAEAKAATQDLLERIKQGPVTLLYGAHDESHNNAVALKEWLKKR